MPNYRLNLGANLRTLRLACGYTQKSVAAALGIVRSSYAYYETGKSQPDVQTLIKLSLMFGVTLDQLALPGEMADPGRLRARQRAAEDPRTIGDLTNEEKALIARLRCGDTRPLAPKGFCSAEKNS